MTVSLSNCRMCKYEIITSLTSEYESCSRLYVVFTAGLCFPQVRRLIVYSWELLDLLSSPEYVEKSQQIDCTCIKSRALSRFKYLIAVNRMISHRMIYHRGSGQIYLLYTNILIFQLSKWISDTVQNTWGWTCISENCFLSICACLFCAFFYSFRNDSLVVLIFCLLL